MVLDVLLDVPQLGGLRLLGSWGPGVLGFEGPRVIGFRVEGAGRQCGFGVRVEGFGTLYRGE